jgi:methyl-accepting chemotaxis protein
MNISRRLLITLTLALCALLVVGVFGLWQLAQANDRFDYVMVNTLPSFDDINKAKAATEDLRLALRDTLLAAGADGRAAIAQRIEVSNKVFDAAIADYLANDISNDADRQLLDADKAAMANYRAIVGSILADANAGQHDKAVTTLAQAAVPAAGVLKAALDAHYKFNVDLASQLSSDNQQAYSAARLLFVALIGLTFVLVGVSSALIYRAIRNGFKQLSSNLVHVSDTLDFRLRAEARRHDEVGEANRAFNRLLDTLQASFQSLVGVAHEVGSASQQLLDTAGQVSAAAMAQSEASANMAATVEQMTVSINHVAEQARSTQSGAHETRELVSTGSTTIHNTIEDIHEISTVVRQSVQSIRELESDSSQVGTVIGTIREIADQTNLLALNAAIEAARAGEQGRGFAVVADEVRKLAERTARSTQEISLTIGTMMSKSKDTTTQMETAGKLVENGVARADEANSAVRHIGDNVNRASAGISEISAAIQQQGVASNNIAIRVEQTAQMAEQASAAARQTADSANLLDSLVKRQLETLASFKI